MLIFIFNEDRHCGSAGHRVTEGTSKPGNLRLHGDVAAVVHVEWAAPRRGKGGVLAVS
jgi:hypothetical protein